METVKNGDQMDHPYTENDIEAFSRDPEGHYFDRKSARKDTNEIAKHLMAFANAAGGKLVVGIEDDGTVTGFKRDKAHSIEGFEQAHVTELTPSPRVETERVPVMNVEGEGDQVLVIDVDFSKDQVVHQRKDGRVALREGDKSVWLDYEQIRALEHDKGEVVFEDAICRKAAVDDLDGDAIDLYRQALGAEGIDDEQLLRSKEFLDDGRPTNACVVLFAREPSQKMPQVRIRVVKVDGKELGSGAAMNVVKDEMFDGPLVKAYPAAKAFIATQLRDFQHEVPGSVFKTVPEYPEFPWTEGLANAIAHRDYSLGGEYIRVYIFDDRMEITSPGKPPNFVTIENMRHSRYSRNPRIARVLTAFKWVREFNEGVKKIYSDMEEAGLPEPEYVLQNGQIVKLTLRNDIEHRVPRLMGGKPSFIPSRSEGINEGIRLSGNERAVLAAIASDPSITTSGIQSATELSESTVYRAVRKLRETGILQRTGSKKNGKWEISKG